MRLFLSLFLLTTISLNSIAHNVVGGVYVSGFDIEGEAGFSNGAMAHAGTVVKVFDQSGTPLGEVETDEEGFFVFTASKRITHVFKLNMGSGHVLNMLLPAEELPESLGIVSASDSRTGSNITSENSIIDTQQSATAITSLMIEKAISKQIKPLRKEIQALKEKSGFRDIIGGIGYIFGLLGLVAFMRERKLKAKDKCPKV